MIYFDGVHLTADTREEMHKFALSIGCHRSWFQDGRHPHYDILGGIANKVRINATKRVVATVSRRLRLCVPTCLTCGGPVVTVRGRPIYSGKRCERCAIDEHGPKVYHPYFVARDETTKANFAAVKAAMLRGLTSVVEIADEENLKRGAVAHAMQLMRDKGQAEYSKRTHQWTLTEKGRMSE